MTYRGEETGTAETLAVEQVPPAVSPEGMAAILEVLDVARGRVRRALLDPESQLLPRARGPMRVLGVKIWAPKDVSITMLVPTNSDQRAGLTCRRPVCWLMSSSCRHLWTASASSACFTSPRS